MRRWMLVAVVAVVVLLAVPLDARAGECASTSAELLDAVNTATAAFSSMDEATFLEARNRARRDLVCLAEPIAAAEAAAYHRMEALAAFFEDRHDEALLAFGAALTLQPDYQLPASIAPEGTPLWDWYRQARDRVPSQQEPLQIPEHCTLLVDGAQGPQHSPDIPAIAQVVEWSGAIRWSGLLAPGRLLPEDAFSEDYAPTWSPDAEAAAAQARLPPADLPHPRKVSPLWYGAGGAALAAGGLYTAALLTRASWEQTAERCALQDGCWEDPVGEQARIDTLRRRTNVLGASSVGVGAVGLGLGFTALVRIDW